MPKAISTKEPLYTPDKLDDMAPGFPNKLVTRPFTQQQYDYNKRLHFGFAVAIGALDYDITSSKQTQYNSKGEAYNYFVDVSTLSPLMSVSALMDYRLNHLFSLRLQVGPTFGTRTLNFFSADTLNLSMQIESVLVEASFLLKYKARRHSDLRPYMIAGLTPYCDVSAFKNFNENRKLFVAVNPFDIAFTAGIGIDAYADFFKFSLEFKYVMGMLNTISPKSLAEFEQYPKSIDKMYMHSIVLSIIFE
ncbi:MAG: PorT family protein [Prevotellaceae bacterium]|nr:PorT family protein [Prevotellaceae bacterium]